RSSDCDVRLRQGPHSDQCSVARHHARLERTDQGAVVRDLGSMNGVYVRGQRVREAALVPGDEIAICGTLRLRLDGAP
ncbi:MAG TPA: FHA domain-containing protein, partial [Myxococcaceae bacterium]